MNVSVLSQALRRAQDVLAAVVSDSGDGGSPIAERALDRLHRDLLPRTAADQPYLIAGIVGPNNAGKSLLFNSLVGAAVSPSLPTGGATRRLVGAAHPELVEALRAEPTLARFPFEPAEWASETPDQRALRSASDASEILVAALPSLPPNLFLVDTPDFDSVLDENRLASESLLAVADLAIVVVTRHTYQNREVVRFLERWLAHGRPWLLVYNEAASESVAREHAAKLAADVGSPPVRVFQAPLSLEAQGGTAWLEPRALGSPAAESLSSFLASLKEIERIKERAMAASLAQLRDDLREVLVSLNGEREGLRGVLTVAESRSEDAARGVAALAMPMGPFLAGFRTVLDRRAGSWLRGARGGLRVARLKIEALARKLRPAGWKRADVAMQDLFALERAELVRLWPSYWEELARDLGAEGRSAARANCPEHWKRLLERDLAASRRDEAARRASERLNSSTLDLEAFQAECETLVQDAFEKRGYDWDIQLGVDAVTITPVALAALIIVKTGGFAADIGMAGSGALSSLLLEKYSHLLGSGITRAAKERWTDLRSKELAEILLATALPESAPAMQAAVEERAREIAELERCLEDLGRGNG